MQDFYEDLFEELSKYGEIESLNICDNLADHMVSIVFNFNCHYFVNAAIEIHLIASWIYAGG